MTTFYTILIALGILGVGCPLSMWLGDKAGVPDYGTNPDQKPGWTVLYIMTLLPTSLAFGYLAILLFLVLVN